MAPRQSPIDRRKGGKRDRPRIRSAGSREPEEATQQWRNYLKKIRAGICVSCSRRRVTSKYCREHAIRENLRYRMGLRFNRCGLCGGLAHNRLTCPKRRRG